MFNLEGFLVSGGHGSFDDPEPKTSVELIDVASGRGCLLPDLPLRRWEHTQVSEE